MQYKNFILQTELRNRIALDLFAIFLYDTF